MATKALEQWRGYGHAEALVEIPAVLHKYADVALPELLRPPVRVDRLTYQNPVEWLIVGAAGFTLYATVQVLRMARDWNSRRRVGSATADIAEAGARIEMARADMAEWMAGEVVAGRFNVPPSELLKLVQPTDLNAVSAALGSEAALELPPGLSSLFGESSGGKGEDE